MSYYDIPDSDLTDAGLLGRDIYMQALSDRRGFREDQLDIFDPEIWIEIFEHIGSVATTRAEAAEARVKRLEGALWRSNHAAADMLTGIGVHNDRKLDRHVPIEGPVVSALIQALAEARAALEEGEKQMSKWTEVRSFHRYPYVVERRGGRDGWCVSWHHKTAGCSSVIAQYSDYGSAMRAAEKHGDENGWKEKP